MKPKPPRRITEVDRLLAYDDQMNRAIGETSKARRRTHRQFGLLELIVVEQTDTPTIVYLSNADSSAIVETRPDELLKAAAAVRELLANPPPIKRKRT